MLVTIAKSETGAGARELYNKAQYLVRGVSMSAMEMEVDQYLRQADYYTHEGATCTWYGGSVETLGLVEGSQVTTKQLRRAFQHIDPTDGHKLAVGQGAGATKLSYMDMTFSMEKDFSVLYMMAPPTVQQRMLELFWHANTEALEEAQADSAVARLGKGGKAHRQSCGFLATRTVHDESRAVNGKVAPHVHEHVNIVNLIYVPGVGWRTTDANRLFKSQKLIAAVASQKLRELVQAEYGFEYERNSKGISGICGFDKEIRTAMSPRSAQLFEEAIKLGLDTSNRDDMIHAQRVSREGKVCSAGGSDESLAWARELLLSKGVSYEQLIQSALAGTALKHRPEHDRAYLATKFGDVPESEDGRKSYLRAAAVHFSRLNEDGSLRELTSDLQPDWDRASAAINFKERSEAEIAHDTLIAVGDQLSTFTQSDLILALADVDVPIDRRYLYTHEFMSGNEVERLTGYLDAPGEPGSIRIRQADNARFATKVTLERERAFLQATREGLGAATRLLTDEQFELVLAEMRRRSLSIDEGSEQYAMLDRILRGTNTINVINGMAGTGKSTALVGLSIARQFLPGDDQQSEDFEDPNKRVLNLVGATLTRNAANGLKASADIDAYSITMLVTRLERGRFTLAPGAIIVLDESSQGATKDLEILRRYQEAAGARFILSGDFRQLTSVAAGGLHRTIFNEVREACVVLSEIRRQRNIEERAVLSCMHDYGMLTEESLAALRRDGVAESLLASLNQVKVVGVTTDPTTGEQKEITIPDIHANYEAAGTWYQDNNRVHFHDNMDQLREAMANEYWDRAALYGDEETGALVMARSTAHAAALAKAIEQEGGRRGLLNLDATIGVGRHRYIVGQKLLARNVDALLDINNGEVVRPVRVEAVDVEWNVEYVTPNPESFARSAKAAPTLGDSQSVKFTRAGVAAQRRDADKLVKSLTRFNNREVPEFPVDWRVAYEVPGDYSRTVNSPPVIGALHEVKFTQREVARQRSVALRNLTQLTNSLNGQPTSDEYSSRLLPAQQYVDWTESLPLKGGTVSLRVRNFEAVDTSSKLAKARAFKEWAHSLPTEGGYVNLEVSSYVPTKSEERLIVRKSDGSERSLSENYIDHHIDSGYALTSQRAQSATVGGGGADSFGYVDMSRGRHDNTAHLVEAKVSQEQLDLECGYVVPARSWLGNRSEDAEVALQAAFERVGNLGTYQDLSIDSRISVQAGTSPDALATGIAASLRIAQHDHQPTIAVARSHAQVNEISNAVGRMVAKASKNSVNPISIDGTLFWPGQPIVITGDLSGVVKGSMGKVQSIAESDAQGHGGGLTVLTETGSQFVAFEAVPSCVETGVAFTVARAVHLNISKDTTILAMAAGLETEHLDWMDKTGAASRLFLDDPNVTHELEYRQRCADRVVQEIMESGQVSIKSLSATDVLAFTASHEVESLRAEMEITARDLQEVYTLPAREVAARDVARDIEQAKNIIADLDARSRSTDNDIDIAERSDALSGVAKYSQDLLELELRHSILANTDDFMDFDPRVETELVLSKQRHSADARRWSQIDARFDQMQQASVEMALADPRAPYLANLVEGVEGESLVDKLRSEVDVLNRVEHFRLKYEVGDTTTILGTVPEEPGVARHEYMELSALLVERAAERERRHEREHDIAEDLDFILSL